MDAPIRIRGARQHNLKNIDLDIPRGALTVVTGPSGSGKSSLALDTLFAEGQRRYVESLSTYAKQFLNRMQKPDVDRIEGIAPAVAIEQKNPTKSSRSTVGTATEVYDYLRLLWARVGRTYCPECEREIRPDTPTGVTDHLLSLRKGTRFQIGFPLTLSAKVRHASAVESLRALGFVRVRVGSDTLDLSSTDADDPKKLGHDLAESQDVFVVVDRLKVDPSERDRLADSVQTAFREGDGDMVVWLTTSDGEQRLDFTERFRCPDHPEIDFKTPTPRFFSFNNPYGSCPECTGFGATLDYDLNLIVPNDGRSLDEGAVDPWSKPRYDKERALIRSFAKDQGVSIHTPWAELPESFRDAVIQGTPTFEGVIPFLKSREKKRYKQYIRVFLRQYQTPTVCTECLGRRLRPEALYVRIGGESIGQIAERSLEELADWIGALELSEMEAAVASSIRAELSSRTDFLVDVGLGYLTLSRQMRTLSGGEAQRINLAGSLGSRLVDTLYVLDEPTIGLHPKDNDRLLNLLERLRTAGNTVVVVEHDSEAIRRADHIVELGPAAGDQGGQVVYEGSPAGLASAETATGLYLAREASPQVERKERRLPGTWLKLKGAQLHNLKGADVEFPLGAMTVVTGVSGSGKSTLVHDILYRGLEQTFGGGETSAKQHLGELVGAFDELSGADNLSGAVLIDQSPIGRTSRSNPVTYIKAWSEVRRIFSEQPLALQKGYGPGHFSFNVTGGRCEVCKGAGHLEIEMIFMADVSVPCGSCQGRRFKSDVLQVKYRGKNLSDVLAMTVDEAIRFFLKEDKLGKALWQLQQVGLGYLGLGQPAPTLSGGEAQRLKIARELVLAASGRRAGAIRGQRTRRSMPGKIYILDEPTTGLSGEDVRRLMLVFDRLLDAGNTLVVIEHNLDVIAGADWLVDLGPGAGDQGGTVVAMGPPSEVAGVAESVTAPYLSELGFVPSS